MGDYSKQSGTSDRVGTRGDALSSISEREGRKDRNDSFSRFCPSEEAMSDPRYEEDIESAGCSSRASKRFKRGESQLLHEGSNQIGGPVGVWGHDRYSRAKEKPTEDLFRRSRFWHTDASGYNKPQRNVHFTWSGNSGYTASMYPPTSNGEECEDPGYVGTNCDWEDSSSEDEIHECPLCGNAWKGPVEPLSESESTPVRGIQPGKVGHRDDEPVPGQVAVQTGLQIPGQAGLLGNSDNK